MDCNVPVNAAVITTEIWDINRFATAIKLNCNVGTYPELNESGNYEDPHPEMTEEGDLTSRCISNEP